MTKFTYQLVPNSLTATNYQETVPCFLGTNYIYDGVYNKLKPSTTHCIVSTVLKG